MKRSIWLFHPILILIYSILALAMSLFLYIHWYMVTSAGLKTIVDKFNIDPDQVLEPQTWVVIMVLSILVGIILIGISIIFVYNHKTVQLYRLQNNFINNFTHELKTPVTSLKLYLETFSKHEISRTDQLKYIKYMMSDINLLSDNINRILNLGMLESKSYGGNFTRTDLVQAVKNFFLNNKHLFQCCEININNPSGRCLYYDIDLSLFEMLLMNLLINSFKYNESEVPKVDIDFNLKKNRLYICFKDNGIGLEKEKIKKIFKKFYQARRADNISASGTGLGLYLVQHIARVHKGKVTASSNGEGKGSLFTLMLPLKMINFE